MRKENSPTLLGFDTKQHIPESPAAPDIYRESRKKNNYNQASASCAQDQQVSRVPISAFLQKLELGASLSSQQDDWFVGNKQLLHAFPICSGPTSKKLKSKHAHTYTKLGVQKWFPVVLYIRDVFKTWLQGLLYGKQAIWTKQQNNQPLWICLCVKVKAFAKKHCVSMVNLPCD